MNLIINILKRKKKSKIRFKKFNDQQLVIEDYSQLETLQLLKINSISKLILRNLGEVKECSIQSCGINELIVDNCPKLESLNVRSNNLTSLDFLKGLNNLKQLEIEGNNELTNLLKPYHSDWKNYQNDLQEITELVNQNNSQELVKKFWKLKKSRQDLKHSIKDILTHLIKNKNSLTTQEVLNQFSHNESTKEIVTNLDSENQSLIQEYQWFKPQFAQQAPVLIKKLGSGAFGEVWQGKWKTQPVAIKKTLHFDESMKEELKLLRDLKSKYIIQYYGEYQQDQEWLIIMEYADQGSLTDFINDHFYTWKEVIDFVKQMTQGLAYLHWEGVIHCDLKSLNVLLTKGQIAKLSDFGISQIIDKKNKGESKSSGTTRWMAPELLINNQPNSFASDIYSLGMVFWELATKSTVPFKDIDDERFIVTAYCRKEREEIPNNTPSSLKEIIRSSWAENPQERISLENIETKINELIVKDEPQLEAQVEISPKK